MSKWEDFKKSFGEFADKTVNKTRELTDAAALKIKIAGKEADRDTEYKKLGKLAYTKLTLLEGQDSEELTRMISEVLESLNGILTELEALKAEEQEKQAAKEAEKEAKTAKKNEKENDVLNLEVMNEFGEARKEADAEYERAKQAAEDAKNVSDAL